MLTPFLAAVQARAARIACGPSTTRGQGPGVMSAGRQFLAQLPLSQFSASCFEQCLDDATKQLCTSFPEAGQSWGLARKILNIFLRDALYTTYLADTFNLKEVEAKLEVPLDRITARQLCQDAGRGVLPRWRGVRHLTPRESASYQESAANLAASKGIARVHLDTYFWGQRDE